MFVALRQKGRDEECYRLPELEWLDQSGDEHLRLFAGEKRQRILGHRLFEVSVADSVRRLVDLDLLQLQQFVVYYQES